MEEKKRSNAISFAYYSRKDIQEAIFNFCRNRETVPRYQETFGKRPDVLEYPSDVLQLIKKNAVSFHCSEELWKNPLELSTELKQEQLNELRIGWDLLIDIDSRYLDYSKIACRLIIDLFKHHNLKNFKIKFSGSKGFHLIVPWKAFPESVSGKKTKDLFPEIPRAIVSYIKDMINQSLIEKISDISIKDRKSYVKDKEEAKKVIPDLVLVSPRHLFRAPYSLHEKGLVSCVIEEDEIKNFNPRMANPLRITVKNFYPTPEQGEAKELLVSALDWAKENIQKKPKIERGFKEIKIDKRKIIYPPSIEKILTGLEDGRKRALFILLNYFRSLGFDFEEIEEKIEEWNKKNKPPLREGYIQSQLSWNKRQKKVLPPNYDKYYQDIGIIPTDEEIRFKNPVNYTVKKIFERRK